MPTIKYDVHDILRNHQGGRIRISPPHRSDKRYLCRDGFHVGPEVVMMGPMGPAYNGFWWENPPRDEADLLDRQQEFLERAVAFLTRAGKALLHNYIHPDQPRQPVDRENLRLLVPGFDGLRFDRAMERLAANLKSFRADLETFCRQHGRKTREQQEQEAKKLQQDLSRETDQERRYREEYEQRLENARKTLA